MTTRTGDEERGASEAGAVRIEVVAGGVPDDAEIAALVLALTPRPAPPAEEPTDGPGAGPPAWARAGLLEGVGGRPAASPADLAAAR